MPKDEAPSLTSVNARNHRKFKTLDVAMGRPLRLQLPQASGMPDMPLRMSGPTYRIEQSDAIDWLTQQPSNSVDLIVTDPPYESLEKHRAVGTTTRLKHSKSSSNDWFAIFPNSRFTELFEQCYRILGRNGHMYLFCDQETMFVAKPIGEQAGFRFWKPLVWDKKTIGMGYHYRCRYELVLFFEKGKRKLNNLGIADVLEAPRVRGGYPTEKPVSIARTLIEQSSSVGQLVCDPFLGSGSTALAALAAGRRFVGCDLSAKSIDHSVERLQSFQRERPSKTEMLRDEISA